MRVGAIVGALVGVDKFSGSGVLVLVAVGVDLHLPPFNITIPGSSNGRLSRDLSTIP